MDTDIAGNSTGSLEILYAAIMVLKPCPSPYLYIVAQAVYQGFSGTRLIQFFLLKLFGLAQHKYTPITDY